MRFRQEMSRRFTIISHPKPMKLGQKEEKYCRNFLVMEIGYLKGHVHVHVQ